MRRSLLRLLPLGLVALLCSPTFAQVEKSTGPLRLPEALNLALEANPELAVARREVDALDAGIQQAGLWRNPEIATLIEDQQRATRSTTVQLNQPIELGGKRSARIDAAERGRDVGVSAFNVKRAEIRAAVMTTFFDTLVAQERVRLARDGVDLALRASTAAQRKVQAGKVAPIEETKARVAESGARIELRLAESELATARKRLAGTWGEVEPRFETVAGDVDLTPALLSRDELNARLETSPALQQARIEVDRRRALADLERSRRFPDLTVSLGNKRNNELGRSQAIVGVSIPIPIFDRNQGNVREARTRVEQARDELAATQVRLAGDAAQAYERLSAAQHELKAMDTEILPGAQSAYDAALKGFEFGKFNFLDVLDAQRTLFQAKSQHLRALGEAYRAAADIDRILGVTDEPALAAAQ